MLPVNESSINALSSLITRVMFWVISMVCILLDLEGIFCNVPDPDNIRFPYAVHTIKMDRVLTDLLNRYPLGDAGCVKLHCYGAGQVLGPDSIDGCCCHFFKVFLICLMSALIILFIIPFG